MVMYATLVVFQRDLDIIMMLIGQVSARLQGRTVDTSILTSWV